MTETASENLLRAENRTQEKIALLLYKDWKNISRKLLRTSQRKNRSGSCSLEKNLQTRIHARRVNNPKNMQKIFKCVIRSLTSKQLLNRL